MPIYEVMVAYGAMGDPVECKLASILRQRDVREGYERLIPFTLNIFSPDTEYREDLCQDVLEYIWCIHQNYVLALDEYGNGKAAKFDTKAYLLYESTTLPPHSYAQVEEAFRHLVAADHIPGSFKLEAFYELSEADFFVAPVYRRRLDAIIDWIQVVYLCLYNPMCIVYESKAPDRNRDIVGNYCQGTIEVMEFLSHLSTAFCLLAYRAQSLRRKEYGKVKKYEDCAYLNIDSAIRHLRMGCLDMMKSVQVSILANENTEPGDLEAILRVRHEYCTRKYGDDKLKGYWRATTSLFEKYLLADALKEGVIASWGDEWIEVPQIERFQKSR